MTLLSSLLVLVQLVFRVPKVFKELRVSKELKEFKAFKEHKEFRAFRESKGFRVFRVSKDSVSGKPTPLEFIPHLMLVLEQPLQMVQQTPTTQPS